MLTSGLFPLQNLIDPDAPSRSNPVNGEILHWMVINIPGNDISKGEGIVAYRGSGAPQGTGKSFVFIILIEIRSIV